ncbi:hypothetical protein EOA37_09540 [Mesorhizobium sp. M2A.F.Ca.ET.015.02.1.1]|uniref:hypothetical protein n=1 Tax=Mesorhizobium sp. M2A.F.Ca.ET.015.02.1.1 TaxID=2496758 RepID=UPI000FCAFA66|nr:hypothetical protein [Mesorhizobium sp. M2A.F.Ca.ET.015.02.1.1]RUW41495.1 hypothetical protein EOA37_09540 [Mesorhizobium sp. M2A.F.Ca.ET.015.02.1.1]
MANHLGTRWRGKIPIPAHAHPLVRQFIAEANEQQTTLTEIADRSGQRRGTLSEWRYSRNPTIASFEAALNVIDLELCIRRRGPRIGRPPKHTEEVRT